MVLFCALGWRSALATKSLVDMGFDNVAHVDGGFDALKKMDLKLLLKKKIIYLLASFKTNSFYPDPKRFCY